MSKIELKITDPDTGESKNITTDGYLLLRFDGDKIKADGKIDIKALAPILTRIALEKLSR